MSNVEIIKAGKTITWESVPEKIANFVPAFRRWLFSRVFRRKALLACLIPFEVLRLAGAYGAKSVSVVAPTSTSFFQLDSCC